MTMLLAPITPINLMARMAQMTIVGCRIKRAVGDSEKLSLRLSAARALLFG